MLDIEHVMEKSNPVAVHYSEIRPIEAYTNLVEFIDSEMKKIKHQVPIVTDAPRLPFTPHLQGIDASQLDN